MAGLRVRFRVIAFPETMNEKQHILDPLQPTPPIDQSYTGVHGTHLFAGFRLCWCFEIHVFNDHSDGVEVCVFGRTLRSREVALDRFGKIRNRVALTSHSMLLSSGPQHLVTPPVLHTDFSVPPDTL